MTYIPNTSRDRERRADLNSSLVRRLIDVTGGIIFTALTGAFISFILINWMTGCGERFANMDGSYTQGSCVYPSDLFTRNHTYPETQTPLENE